MLYQYMWLVFLVALALLSAIGVWAARFLGRRSLAVFIGGDDDRLSLSKTQAFAWTLIIMSSYLAAMFVHEKFGLGDHWIQIPSELLALAGIVLTANVFSSVISAVKEERRTSEITQLAFADPVLTITGSGFGTNRGAVRIVGKNGKRWELSIATWSDVQITVTVATTPAQTIFAATATAADPIINTLIVDTQNGKACYRFAFDGTTATLKEAIIFYEFVDFFRDDQNPSVLSIMKYQMFTWTLIAIGIYLYIFLTNPGNKITTLPVLDRTIVILTGLSQAGYLGGKAAPK
jgi:hypothetical protein